MVFVIGMIWLTSSEGGNAKHPSTMFWKFGNQTKTFKGWDKEAGQKIEFDPVGKEWCIVWIGWCFSGWSTEADKAIYSTEVPYSELSNREIQVYYFDNDRKVSIFKGVYNREENKEMLKGKGANLFLNIHVLCGEGWEAHIETLQVKWLNVISVMEALKKGDYDNKRFAITWLEEKKYKVITYSEIVCGEGAEMSEKEKEDLHRMEEELQAYYDAGKNGIKKDEKKVEEFDSLFPDQPTTTVDVEEVKKKQEEAIAKWKKKTEEKKVEVKEKVEEKKEDDDYDLPF